MAATDPNDPNHRHAPDAGDRNTGNPLPWLLLMAGVLIIAVIAIFAWGLFQGHEDEAEPSQNPGGIDTSFVVPVEQGLSVGQASSLPLAQRAKFAVTDFGLRPKAGWKPAPPDSASACETAAYRAVDSHLADATPTPSAAATPRRGRVAAGA